MENTQQRNMPVFVRRLSDFNDSELVFNEKSFITSNGSRLVSFTYYGTPLYIQTPVLTCTTGFRVFSNPTETTRSFNDKSHQQQKTTTHSLMLSCTSDFVDMMTEIDKAVLNAIMEHSETWFTKKYSNIDVLKELFNSSIKCKANYPPSFSVRLKFNDNQPIFGIFDTEKEPVHISNVSELCTRIPRKTTLKIIAVSGSIWYSSGRCGISWDASQIKLCDTPCVLLNTKNYMFIEDDDTDV